MKYIVLYVMCFLHRIVPLTIAIDTSHDYPSLAYSIDGWTMKWSEVNLFYARKMELAVFEGRWIIGLLNDERTTDCTVLYVL